MRVRRTSGGSDMYIVIVWEREEVGGRGEIRGDKGRILDGWVSEGEAVMRGRGRELRGGRREGKGRVHT